MSVNPKKTMGNWGETQAESYLLSKGYDILERNFFTRYGEIDLIAKDGDELVFIEVKTRSSNQFGYPEESVTVKKQDHLKKAAEVYLQSHYQEMITWRIDIISISRYTEKPDCFDLVHLEDAVH